MMSMDTEVFVYTGRQGGKYVPRDVVRVRVDPSVMSIPAEAFCGRMKLTDVELCEGLVEIGDDAFRWCSITKIIIPASLRRINDSAFYNSVQCPIHLHDGIESIGNWAFFGCTSPTLESRPNDSRQHVKVVHIHVLRGNTIDRN